MLPVSGDAFVLDDLAASFTEPWICARDGHLWDAGAHRIERLWSLAVATDGNRWRVRTAA